MARRPGPGSVRQVVTGRSDGYTGRVPFALADRRTVPYESLLARDLLVQTAAFEHDVTAIVSEPAQFDIPHGRSAFVWISDYRFDRVTGPSEQVEVKPIEIVDPSRSTTFQGNADEREAACREADARFESIAAAMRALGFTFRLVTEDEIRIEPRLGNAALVLRYAIEHFPMAWLLKAREALASREIACVDDLQAALPKLDAFVIALRLQWEGDLDIDPMRRFSRSSRFSRVGRTTHALPFPPMEKTR